MAPGNTAAPRPTLARTLIENVECLAIAIVMALVLKYFLVEAYKIPTGSMQPTIMGDRETRIFDRVLVNKMVYFFREPERYEVIVFKNPLNHRQNYIKRLVGLSGEHLVIENGDIFVVRGEGEGRGVEEIQRKSDSVWRSVRKRVFPRKSGDPPQQFFQISAGTAEIDGKRIDLLAQDGEAAAIRNARSIRDSYFDGYDPRWVVSEPPVRHQSAHVHDVELIATVEPGPDAQEVRFQIQEGDLMHQVALDCKTGQVAMVTGSRTRAEDPSATEPVFVGDELGPRSGDSARVSFRNVDDELVLRIDGDEVARHPYTAQQPSSPNQRTYVLVETRRGTVSLTDVEVYRDIHYLSRGTAGDHRAAHYKVPEGHFFALGDNTQSSSDCRQWKRVIYRWNQETEDGQTVSREEVGNYFDPWGHAHPDANPRWDDPFRKRAILFRNQYGQLYEIDPRSVTTPLNDPDIQPYNSVPNELLLGKALAVFWPLPPFSPTWRLKWVR